jgi:excisionase family DNA binding protein
MATTSERVRTKKRAPSSKRAKTASEVVRSRTGAISKSPATRSRSKPDAAVSLRAALAEAGIDASSSEFLRLVRDAVDSIRTVPALDPGEQLSTTEMEALERGGFDLSHPRRGEDGPLSGTVAAYVAMMDDALSVAEGAKRLRVDQSRIRQLLSNGSLFGVKVRGEWRLPRFQFTNRGVLRGIQEVLRAMPGGLHPVEVMKWLSNPDPDLEIGEQSLSPLDWLRSGGDPQRASDVAKDL